VQRPVEICAWSDAQFLDYVHRACAQLPPEVREQRIEQIRALFKNYPDLKKKPFFVSRVTDLVIAGTKFEENGSLLASLVSAYLGREHTEKLLDRAGKPLVSVAQLEELYAELSEEMWNQQTRELDARSVRELAEFVLQSNGIAGTESSVVVQRMPTMAFLANGARPNSVVFEHESFFNFFLAARLNQKLTTGTDSLDRFLGRGVLPDEVVFHTLAVSSVGTDDGIQRILALVSQASQRSTLTRHVVRESAGVLARGLLSVRPTASGLRVSSVDVPGGSLKGTTLVDVHFEDVEFRRVDFCGATLDKCNCRQTRFVEITIDLESSRLDLSGTVGISDFQGLRVYSSNGLHLTYDPTEIQDALVTIGAIDAAPQQQGRVVAEEILKLLDVLARGYLRSNPLTVEDNKLGALKRSPLWPALEESLVHHGIVTLEERETKGAKKRFLRRQVDIWSVIEARNGSGAADPVKEALWDELERRFPPK
jgi:hypothetical protein